MLVTAVLTPEDDGFVAYNPETGTASQGDSIEASLANLREAVELYLEEFPLKRPGHPIFTVLEVGQHA